MDEKRCRRHGKDVRWRCGVCGLGLCEECGGIRYGGALYCRGCMEGAEAAAAGPVPDGHSSSLRSRARAVVVFLGAALVMAVLYKGCSVFDRLLMGWGYGEDAPAAPAFTATDTAGRRHSLQEMRGKVVVLDFWASWCAPCVRLIPDLKRLHERYRGRDVVLLGVNRDRTRADLQAAVMKHGIDWPQVFDTGSEPSLSALFGVDELPATVIIDQEGRVFRRWGVMDRAIGRYVDFLLDESGEEGAPGKADELPGVGRD